MSPPDDPDRAVARELRLRGDPPPVVRLSRRAVALSLAAAGVAIASVTGWAVSHHPRPHIAPTPAPAPPEARPPERLASLPKDYASLPAGVPRLGPPLPGDLGRPIVAAGGGGGATSTDPQAQQRETERRQARASRLFATAAPAASLPAPSVPSSEAAAAVAVDTVSAGASIPPASPYLLPAGTTIRAALITGLRSGLPGLVTAQVTEDVHDGVSGRWRLIPRGSRLLGAYDNRVAFGQSRVLLTWSRLILPDGRAVDLGKEPATDAQGYAGLEDRVDHHWHQLFGAAAVTLGLAAAGELGRDSDEDGLAEAMRRALTDTTSDVGARVVGRSLDVAPTLTVRPGFPVRVLLTRDLVLEPWSGP